MDTTFDYICDLIFFLADHFKLKLSSIPHKAVTLPLAALAAYLLLVRSLRWRRYYAIHAKYEEKWRAGKLTVAEAQKVVHTTNSYDMPFLVNKSLGLAMFKTYAIPTISKLLLTTKELASSEKVAKRYADTETLIALYIACPLSGFHDPNASPSSSTPAEDPRASIALARTNFIHSRYKISNDDFLYTMGLFVLEPAAWAQRHGWRAMSDMEQDAYFIVWKDIAAKMEIRDVPPTLEELRTWCQNYEEVHMVPDPANEKVARYTLDEFLFPLPRGPLRNAAESIMVALLEPERLRIAMRFPKPPLISYWIASLSMKLFWISQRYLCLPRSDANHGYIADIHLPKPDPDGEIRLRPSVYRSTPWYKPEPKNIVSRTFSRFLVLIGYYASVPSSRYKSNGYRVEDMGPESFEGLGIDEVMRNAERIQGCPIVAPWAPPKSSSGANISP